jgi:hypothetical protein
MRWRLSTLIALAVTLLFHALLGAFLWRALIAPPAPAPGPQIRWVELASATQLKRAVIAPTQAPTPRQSPIVRLTPQRLSIEPASLAAIPAQLGEPPSSQELLASVRASAQTRERGEFAQENQAARVLNNPRIRAPGVPTPAIDRHFRDPSRRALNALPDAGDGVRRFVRVDEFGHEFSCSQRLGSPNDPLGMETKVTCSFVTDGASNTEAWFKVRAID